eukprot:m.43131 g.43131  ORF g.43131 m.43131 type:complete len:582 (-) comp12003_c0_seq1:31-1776(-)
MQMIKTAAKGKAKEKNDQQKAARSKKAESSDDEEDSDEEDTDDGDSTSDNDVEEEEEDDEEEEDEEDEEEDADDDEMTVRTTDDLVAESADKTDKQLRKAHKINTKGEDVPRPIVAFQQLKEYNIQQALLEDLCQMHTQPTPIQMQGIPIMLKKRDIVGIAPTGSGKTCTFVVPLLALLKKHKDTGFRALVLAPTPELAKQIKSEFDLLNARLKLSVQLLTKSSVGVLKKTSRKAHDILVSTPMRLVHYLKHEVITLSSVEWIVVDEADTLFENGYEKQLDQIISACTNRKHVSLFSATMPERVVHLARSVLKNYIRVTVGVHNAAATTVDQQLLFTGDELGKMHALRNLIREGIAPPVLIFVQSKERATHLFGELVYSGLHVDLIHADRTPQQRTAAVREFREGRTWILICTDLMGRGIDFKGVNLVINFDFPPSANEYIHRVGRTGRAGRPGRAITFFTQKDAPILRSVATVVRASGCSVPDWVFELKGLRKKQRSRTVTREAISSNAAVMLRDKAKRRQWAEQHAENKEKRAKMKAASKSAGRQRGHDEDGEDILDDDDDHLEGQEDGDDFDLDSDEN